MEAFSLFENMWNSSLKAAILTSDADYKVIRAGRTNVPKVMIQKITNDPVGVCTLRNNYAFKLVEGTMSNLIQGGISQYMIDYLYNFEVKPLVDPPREPSVFSLSDLEFGFVVWLIACGISTAAFTVELLWYFLSVKLKDLIVLIVFLRRLKRIRKY